MPTDPLMPPYPQPDMALFLDFDGTLVPLAATPDSIIVPPGLVPLLQKLQTLLGGAVAVISGREIAAVDRYIHPLRLPCAGSHGAERRRADGQQSQLLGDGLEHIATACWQLAARHPALLVESKPSGVALHYRRDPTLEPQCLRVLEAAVAGRPDWVLVRGKCVIEALPAGINKGAAIAAFMQEAPFAGRTACFAGDDVTDETGFSVVQQQQGVAIKVGPGASCARYRLGGVPQVHAWLHTASAQLTARRSLEARV